MTKVQSTSAILSLSAEDELFVLWGRLQISAAKSKELSHIWREAAIGEYVKGQEKQISNYNSLGRVFLHLGNIGLLGVATAFSVAPDGLGSLCGKLGERLPWLKGFIQNKGFDDYRALADKVNKVCTTGSEVFRAGIAIEENLSKAILTKAGYKSELAKLVGENNEKESVNERALREEARDFMDKHRQMMLEMMKAACR